MARLGDPDYLLQELNFTSEFLSKNIFHLMNIIFENVLHHETST